MSSWLEVAKGFGQLAKDFTLLKERFDRQEKQLEEHKKAIVELREENAKLTTRVAVLEEGRKTTAAEVKAALTETIAAWELQKLRDENTGLRRAQLPLSKPEKSE